MARCRAEPRRRDDQTRKGRRRAALIREWEIYRAKKTLFYQRPGAMTDKSCPRIFYNRNGPSRFPFRRFGGTRLAAPDQIYKLVGNRPIGVGDQPLVIVKTQNPPDEVPAGRLSNLNFVRCNTPTLRKCQSDSQAVPHRNRLSPYWRRRRSPPFGCVWLT